MPRFHRRPRTPAAILLGATALALALTGCAPGAPDPSVTGASVRVPANPDVTAGYLTIDNTGGAEAVLTGATTDAAAEVQMHDTRDADGRMTMERQKEVPIPADSTVEFASGGLHLMLMEPDDLKAGDTIELTLEFEEAEPITVDAHVEDVMADSEDPDGMDGTDHSGH